MKTIKGKKEILEKRAANLIIKQIKKLKKQEKIVLGIPGGRSVSGIFKLLKNLPQNVHIFLVDERRVPTTNKQSNYNLARKYFPKENLHPYSYNRELKDYENDLKAHGGKFDIILLSSGEDCHVAGLFPNYTIKNSSNQFIEFDNSPKPPKRRMSASRKLLQKSNMAILLFFGESKEKAYKKFKSKVSATKCPAKLVNNIKESYVLVTF